MFYIQDGDFDESLTTHEAILSAANEKGKCYGAGIFAFVTSEGASLVFEDAVLSKFMEEGKFTLIVGIDDITNTKAINKLHSLENFHKNKLDVKVFLHKKSKSLFHPKFIWFKFDKKINLITGSSNLTTKGLRRNFEAFTSETYHGDEARNFEKYWGKWLEANKENLYELNHEDVIKKTERNSKRFSIWKRLSKEEERKPSTEENPPPSIINESFEDEDYEAWCIGEDSRVFIGEISKNRSGQADVGVDAFFKFFGVIRQTESVGERRILLRNVSELGILRELEVRKGFQVQSNNYRVELAALKPIHRSYPMGVDKPIGIFIKVSTRTFLYSIVVPDEPFYNEVLQFVDLNGKKTKFNGMRRFYTTVEHLRVNCPSQAFWLIK